MNESIESLYQKGMTPRQLAQKVLENSFGDQMPSIPLDPFKLMRDYGIIYQFMGFKELEGIYLVPQDENDVPVVGINYNRPITRQRYTAAHELCHHIKDRISRLCPISNGDDVERYAENFAAELLMPEELFRQVASEYAKDGIVTLDATLLIAERFGVSFRSCALRLAYNFRMLEGGIDDLNKRLKKYKPDYKKKELGIDIENIDLLRQAVDSYPFFFNMDDGIIWLRFKEDFIYNENRMEGVNLDLDEVSEIVTDLRMNGQNSDYCKEDYEEIIQVVGHSFIYDYISQTKDNLSIYKLLDLNKMLYKYAPFAEEAGKTRTSNNLVLGTKFETSDYRDVPMDLYKLQKPVEDLIKNAESLSVSEYLLDAVKIHHRITQIHPFQDGNGRCSRALLNWMLRIKGLPPIYIRNENKEAYYTALELADTKGEYKELLRLIIRELFRTMLRLGAGPKWMIAD